MSPRSVRVAACIGCGTPIIGERPRCPACHATHADQVVALISDPSDDDVTAPRSLYDVEATRPRPRWNERGDAPVSLLARWVAVVEVLVIVALVLALAVRSCS